MTTAKVTNLKTAAAGFAADQLGDLRAQIKRLKDEAKILETVLTNHGEDIVEGSRYRVAIVQSERKITDWKKIAIDLGATNKKIAGNTRAFGVTAVKVSAHKK